ncbi:amidase [Solicola gregarius]|uniref:Amidase n=1 Tax=Solicola gregarius TaxID=2908642 RepID=A0AA46YL95_9ACTN|nr:amidase [Solicola gregarius]UYM06357.1 amidase [Solicola gregarius]
MTTTSSRSPGRAAACTASEAARAMERGEFMAVRYVEDVIAAIVEAENGSFVETYPDEAMESARRSDERRGCRPAGPLEGVVFAVKDSVDVRGHASAAGSRSTDGDLLPTADAKVVSRLTDAGAILIGKLVLEELGIGLTAEDSAVPAPRNPWNHERSTGGSSSGCGVAVAAGLVPIAIGSDTAGSIRLPAAHCGVVGLKPSHDLIDRRGVLPLAPSLDDVGVVTRDVEDAALVLRSLLDLSPTGPAPRLEGMRLGVVDLGSAASRRVDAEVSAALARAVAGMRTQGAIIERVDPAPLEVYQRCGATILHAEAYREFRHRLETRGADMHRSTYRRLTSGAHISAAELADARRLRADLTRMFDRTMAHVDALVTITTLSPPGPAIGPDLRDDGSRALSPRMPFNVVGAPAIAVPVGLTSDGMPLSVQLVGARGKDWHLLRIAEAWQREFPTAGGPPRSTRTRRRGKGRVQ